MTNLENEHSSNVSDQPREARDRDLVITYQASHLVEVFGVSMQRAIELVNRYGVHRRKLMKGLETELGEKAGELRTRPHRGRRLSYPGRT